MLAGIYGYAKQNCCMIVVVASITGASIHKIGVDDL